MKIKGIWIRISDTSQIPHRSMEFTESRQMPTILNGRLNNISIPVLWAVVIFNCKPDPLELNSGSRSFIIPFISGMRFVITASITISVSWSDYSATRRHLWLLRSQPRLPFPDQSPFLRIINQEVQFLLIHLSGEVICNLTRFTPMHMLSPADHRQATILWQWSESTAQV